MEYKLTDYYKKLSLVFEKIKDMIKTIIDAIRSFVVKVIGLFKKNKKLLYHQKHYNNIKRRKFDVVKKIYIHKTIRRVNIKNLPYQRRNY